MTPRKEYYAKFKEKLKADARKWKEEQKLKLNPCTKFRKMVDGEMTRDPFLWIVTLENAKNARNSTMKTKKTTKL